MICTGNITVLDFNLLLKSLPVRAGFSFNVSFIICHHNVRNAKSKDIYIRGIISNAIF
jgi:hypothetical protein